MAFDSEMWEEEGYLVVRNAVPQELLEPVIADMERFRGIPFSDRDRWYDAPVGMVNMYDSPALYATRESPAIHEAFTGIWGTEKLWVTRNRTNFNPPANETYTHEGFIHWDIDVGKRPIELRTQGVLCLRDTPPGMGGFQCIPGSHRRVQEWHDSHPPEEKPTKEAIMGDSPIHRVDGKAGDLIIWQASLLHGNGRNTLDRPRFAQYICMVPEDHARTGQGLIEGGEELREARIEAWRIGGYSQALCDRVGIRHGIWDHYARRLLSSSEVPDAPVDLKSHHSGDSEVPIEDFVAYLDAERPWERESVASANTLVRGRFGVTLSDLPVATLSKEIARDLERAHGVRIEVKPAPLSALGERLLGLRRWD